MTDEPSTRPRKATGPDRPAYFTHTDLDRVMGILLALISEVASMRDRIDTHERIAGSGEAVKAYVPDDQAAAEREAWRSAYIRRLFRVITEDVEALKADDPSA